MQKQPSRFILYLLFGGIAIIAAIALFSYLNNCNNRFYRVCKQMLFIGNSYTYVNDLPGTLAEIAKAGGQQIEIAMVAEERLSLADHAPSQATLRMIQERQWDYIVLQEQSQLPSVVSIRNQRMFPAAHQLIQPIRKQQAKPAPAKHCSPDSLTE